MFKIKEIKPLFTGVVTTAMKYVSNVTSDSGLILPGKMEGQLNYFQWVEAVGDMVTGIKKGDIVRINFKRYAIASHVPGAIDADANVQHDNMSIKYEIPMVNIDGRDFLFLQNNDIEYVVTRFEGVDEGGLLQ